MFSPITRLIVCTSTLLAFTACGGSSGGGATPAGLNGGVNLSGTYSQTTKVESHSGDEELQNTFDDAVGSSKTDDITLAHETASNKLSVLEGTAVQNTATMSGRSVTFTETETAGDIKIVSTINATFSADGKSFSGTIRTVLTRAGKTATEVETINATKKEGGASTLNLAGTYSEAKEITSRSGDPVIQALFENAIGFKETDDVTYTHDLATNKLTIVDGVTVIVSATLNGLSVTFTRNSTNSGFQIAEKRSITFAADGRSYTGTDVVSASKDGKTASETVTLTATKK